MGNVWLVSNARRAAFGKVPFALQSAVITVTTDFRA